MDLVQDTGGIIAEPDWQRILKRRGEREAAAHYWQTIADEMRGRQTLSPANAHAVFRLVLALVIYDRTMIAVARKGAVNEPAKGNTRAIPRINPYFTAMKEAAALIAASEAELGLAPRRRNAVGKVAQPRRQTGANRYLKSLKGGLTDPPALPVSPKEGNDK